jgi:hypothetical protein
VHPLSGARFQIRETLADPLLRAAKEYFPGIAPEHLLQQQGRDISRSFKVSFADPGFLQVKINSQLNFQRALVSMIRFIATKDAEYEKYLLGITKWGRICYLGTNPLIPEAYNTFQDQVADLIGMQVRKQQIIEIPKQVSDGIKDSESLDFLEKNLWEAIHHLNTDQTLENHLPYDAIFFTSISVEELQQLAKEVTWNNNSDQMEPHTTRSYKKLLFLESIAMDAFLALNTVEGFEKREDIRIRDKVQYIDIQEITEGIILSPYYSESLFFPIIRVPESSEVLKQGSWRSFSFNLAKKSFEVLGLPDRDEDNSATFTFKINSVEYLVYSYAFTVNTPKDEQTQQFYKMEENSHTNFTISVITKNEKLKPFQRRNEEKIIYAELHQIANMIKNSPEIKRVQGRLVWHKYWGQEFKDDAPGWEECMVLQYVDFLLTHDELYKTHNQFRKLWRNLLNRLQMSSESN